jgi:tetratricopeptide (TPR) repeat protein
MEISMKFLKPIFFFTLFTAVVLAGPDLESAKIRIKDKDWKEAERYLLLAINHPKDKWEAAFHLGDKIYVRTEEWSKVREYMNIALTADSKLKIRPTANDRKIPIEQAVNASLAKSYNLIYYKATGYLKLLSAAQSEEQKNMFLEQAIATSSKAVELDPNQPGAYALLALYSSVQGQKDETKKYLDLALGLPDLTDETVLALLVSAGQSMVRLSEFDIALDYYNRALEIDANEPSVLKNVGALYLAKEDFDSALSNLNQAIEVTEDEKELVDLYFNRGLVYLKMEKFDEAEFNFEEAYYLAPEDEEALLGLARALEEAERWRKSRNYYMELIDKDPNNSAYYYGVYRTYFGEGRLADAQEYLNKANALR